jgi:uncharacterized protein YkwD
MTSVSAQRIALHLASRRLALATALAFAVTSIGLLAAPARAWSEGSYSSGSERQVVALQNQARASAGLRTLKTDGALRTIARWRSKDMAERDYLSHTVKGTSRGVFWYMQYEYDYCFKVAGENIGTVTWPGASESDVTTYVFNEWMKSSGHRANIMGKAWDVVGVGAIRWTADRYVWTVLFADACGSAAKATPKPTARPTPKPTRKPTPEPTARPTPKPTTRPTPKPERTTTPAPSSPPSSVLEPSPGPTPTLEPSPSAIATPSAATPSAGPPAEPAPAPIPTAPPGTGWTTFRVLDRPAEPGLVDSVLDAIAARYFGY